MFNLFLKFFQSEEPLIRLLYDQLIPLLKVLIGRFIRKELLTSKAAKKLAKIRLEVSENYLAYREMEKGEQIHWEVFDVM